MRAFDLVRHEDETGVSGTGRVAEGVVFDDGSVVMRWLTAIRSTTLFPDLQSVRHIHGHNGKTIVLFRDGADEHVRLPKPHLALGAEGKYADGSRYDQGGCLPVVEGAREAYDALREISAPKGWTAMACWFSHGHACLELRSPDVFLRSEVVDGDEPCVRTYHEHQLVQLEVEPSGPSGVTLRDAKHRSSERASDHVFVHGQSFRASWVTTVRTTAKEA